MPSNLILHLDMDGVLCDFDHGFKQISGGISPEDYKAKYGKGTEAKLFLSKGPEFWAGLPWLEGGLELYKFAVANFQVVRILTSSGTGKDWVKFKEVAQGKTTWIETHIPGFPRKNIIIVPFPNLKARHAGPDRILVDDRDRTIALWIEKGGIGLLHHHSSWKNTIDDLKEYAAAPIKLKEIVDSL